jgi:curved DNA-binding protein CbpA
MFDPYHRWLAIPPGPRPPSHYQLLGVSPDETDPEVIAEAALRQTSHVRTYQTGPHAARCQALLNEISQAKVTLLDPRKRKEYDERQAPSAPPPGRQPEAEPEAEPGAVESAVSGAEPLAFDFPGAGGRGTAGNPGPAAPLALAYAVLLLLGAALAFWLGFTGP